LDLRPWGIAGRAIQRPGHTPGSLVVLFEDGRAVVGDLMLGGYLGGAILPHRAGEHYFHADLARNLENIRWLLAQGAKEFYLGHGGPVDRAAVIEAFGVATPAAPK
jgi:glyoxylase-like metal-dependent hydrolase (beta-lactamase superfamily II)